MDKDLQRALQPSHHGGHVVRVRVTPGARKSELLAIDNTGVLRIKVQAPPIDGKANEAVIALLADLFSCRRREINLLSGEKSREKRFLLTNPSFGSSSPSERRK